MKTNIASSLRDTPEAQEADAILRSCVHCGFCLATCPTYQLLGDELDSPRGRIYLMKQVLEGAPVTAKTQLHLDRCLTCRACETTCPSGVKYGRLVDIGRGIVEARVGRSPAAALQRRAMRMVFSRPALFEPLLRVGQTARPLMPSRLRSKVPERRAGMAWPAPRHARRMVALDGCVQPGLAPNINAAAARLLDAIGISLVRADQAGCCGAIAYHLNDQAAGLDNARRNIAAWWPHLQQGAEAIVITASGCGAMIKEWGHLLRQDPLWADKAARATELAHDVSEVILAEKEKLLTLLRNARVRATPERLAFHSPCSLQHALRIRGVVEELLSTAGFRLTPVPDGHLCCGSAGTYSILQPDLSRRLLSNKVAALESGKPEVIVTANIGCLTHIQSGTSTPVRHWVEVLEALLVGTDGQP